MVMQYYKCFEGTSCFDSLPSQFIQSEEFAYIFPFTLSFNVATNNIAIGYAAIFRATLSACLLIYVLSPNQRLLRVLSCVLPRK
jgi:hypothetical protein